MLKPTTLSPEGLRLEINRIQRKQPALARYGNQIVIHSASLRNRLLELVQPEEEDPVSFEELALQNLISMQMPTESVTRRIEIGQHTFEVDIDFEDGEREIRISCGLRKETALLMKGVVQVLKGTDGKNRSFTEIKHFINSPQVLELLSDFAKELHGKMFELVQALANQLEIEIFHTETYPNRAQLKEWEAYAVNQLAPNGFHRIQRGAWAKTYTPEYPS